MDETTPFLPGTINVFIARGGAGTVDQIRAAGSSQDEIRAIIRGIVEDARDLQPMSFEAASAYLVEQPVFGELRYGGTALLQNLILPPGLDAFMLTLPYNGGRLSPEGFRLAEFYQEGTDSSSDAVIIRSHPTLTVAEQAALEAVPEDQWENNVGKAIDCDTTCGPSPL